MLKKIIFSLVCGLVATCSYLAYDPYIIKGVQTHLCTTFSKMFVCAFSARVSSLSFVNPRITMEDVYVKPKEGDGWYWTAQTFTMHFSWWYLLTHGALNLEVVLEDAHVFSQYSSQSLAIMPHIQAMFCGPVEAPILLSSVTLHNAHMHVQDTDHAIDYALTLHNQTKKMNGDSHAQLHIIDGSIAKDAKQIIHQFLGSGSICVVPCLGKESGITAKAHISCQLEESKDCIATHFSWENDTGSCSLSSSDPSLFASCEKNNETLQISGSVPFSLVCSFFPQLPLSKGTLQWHVAHEDTKLFGSIAIADCMIKEYHHALSMSAFFQSTDLQKITGTYAVAVEDEPSFDGTWSYENGMVDATLCNQQTWIADGLPPHYLEAGTILTTLHVDIVNQRIAACSDYAPIQFLLHKHANTFIPGAGTFSLNVWRDDAGFAGNIRFADGALRLAPTTSYLVSCDLHGHCDLNTNTITCTDCTCTLSQGTMQSTHGWIHFDPSHKNVSWYFPIQFNNCLVSMARGIKGSISGSLVCKKNKQGSCIESKIVADAITIEAPSLSPLRMHHFSHAQKTPSSMAQDTHLDMSIATKHDGILDTPLVQGTIQANAHITQTLGSPYVQADLNIHDGWIHFPYAPLQMLHASITTNPLQLDDPLLSLYATNTIKGYTVSLRVDGTLHDHHVTFSSYPSLSQEAIIGLLFAGSTTASLPMIVPAVMVQYIKRLLFSLHEPLAPDTYMRRIVDPHTRVHFIPHFADQKGRGGIRGALEVTIGERWRALFQKNFSLTEDTRFELEYALSDEMKLRGVRDERGDVTGEVELQWKF